MAEEALRGGSLKGPTQRPSRPRGLLRALRRDERGQALVEFALVLPIFILLLVAIFDLGRAVFAYNTLTNAAREGAVYRIFLWLVFAAHRVQPRRRYGDHSTGSERRRKARRP